WTPKVSRSGGRGSKPVVCLAARLPTLSFRRKQLIRHRFPARAGIDKRSFACAKGQHQEEHMSRGMMSTLTTMALLCFGATLPAGTAAAQTARDLVGTWPPSSDGRLPA